MMLREGWDVKNVTTIVGIRSFGAKNKILPEQAIGRGLRRMERGEDSFDEKLTVIGTPAFIEFVEQLKSEGVILEMPIESDKREYIEVDHEKDLDVLDIPLPQLPAIYQYTQDASKWHSIRFSIPHTRKKIYSPFSSASPSKSVPLVDVITEKEEVDRLEVRTAVTSANGLVNYLVKELLQKAGLSSTYQANKLFKEVKRFIEEDFYVSPVSMEDIEFRKYFSIDYPPDKNDALTIMRNQFLEQVLETIPDQQRNIKFKEYRHSKKTIRPSNEPFELEPLQRSMFNKATFTHKLELEIAEFLDKKANDVEAWFKNTINGTAFFLDYTSKAKSIRRYYPDFIVRASDGTIYIVEAKGNDDLDAPLKHERLNTFVSMCNQNLGMPNKFKSLKIYETDWKHNRRNIYSMEDLYSFSLK